jgi:GT2 family glycosyltransferase
MEMPARSTVCLSVSIVLYHSETAMLQRALDSLCLSASAAIASGRLQEIIIYLVDNTPDQDYRASVQRLVTDWSHAQTCPLYYSGTSTNLGFGAANNTVLAELDSKYHLVLNPDVELFEDTLIRGLECLEGDPRIALVSPRVETAAGVQEFLCKRYPSVAVLLLRGFAPTWVRARWRGLLDRYEMRDVCGGDRVCDIPLASGCFMLLRTSILQRVGGFSAGYFLYFEDFDLSLKLVAEGRVVFDPAIHIVHHGGYAARKGWRHLKLFVRSGVQFFNDHGWRWI